MSRNDIDTSDFYSYEHLLTDDERQLLHAVRKFMKTDVAPVLLEHWSRATFPLEVVPGMRELGLAGLPYHGDGCGGRRYLLDGMIAMELARTDCSIATFNGVHGGLAMGSIYLCGSDEQRERFLPAMARYDKIGSFGLTEPEVGSGASGGLQTTAQRNGDTWILNGQKKWIGNSTFGDLTVIWANDVADGRVKGFVVENSSPGFTVEKQMHKIALRIVQNGLITLDNVRVDESDRLQRADSFKDTAEVLRIPAPGWRGWRSVVPWAPMRTRWPMRVADASSAGRSADSNWSRTCWCECSATSRRPMGCACGCRNCRMKGTPKIGTPRWRKPSAPCGCVKPWAGRANCSAETESCWSTTWVASSPMPKRSTPMKEPER
jgi:hypothetical protein